MTAVKRILCPTDFSECSRYALDHAAALAQWYGARISVVHVNELMPHSRTPWVASSMTPPSPTEIASALARFVEPLSRGIVPVETLSEEGDPVRTIVAKATELSCDLIVLGTHGRGGFEHLVLGSVTEKVLRKAACPVLIVPPAVTQPARPIQFKRILCPLDCGPSSVMALRQALAMARETGAHLTVLHVLDRLEDEPRAVPVAVPEYRWLREEQAREDLHRALSAEEHAETVGMVVTGTPYREIVRVAGETRTDLIFMGVAGGGTLRRLFLGSTTNRVIREATCPVLTVRAPHSTENTSFGERRRGPDDMEGTLTTH